MAPYTMPLLPPEKAFVIDLPSSENPNSGDDTTRISKLAAAIILVVNTITSRLTIVTVISLLNRRKEVPYGTILLISLPVAMTYVIAMALLLNKPKLIKIPIADMKTIAIGAALIGSLTACVGAIFVFGNT